MSAIVPVDQFHPPGTPIEEGADRFTDDSPPPATEIREPSPIAGDSESIGGTVYNTPTYETVDVVGAWTGRFPNGGSITARYLEQGSASVQSQASQIETPPLGFNLKRSRTDYIVPGSVRFTLNGRTYLDRQGDLVSNVDPLTNAGTVAGYISYRTGWTVIEDWDQGDGLIDIKGLGLVAGTSPTNKIFFRTPAAPIAQASLTIQAVAYGSGELIQATADVNGNISGDQVEGFVDVENGIVECFFGEWVVAAGNEGEWWYNADAINGEGDIFKPTRIVPSSAFFSCVVLTSIPLDPGILGLDPILLPSDGRVPVFRPGNSLMVVQRNVVQDAAPSAGSTVDLGIQNIRFVRVRDANGAEVVSDQYTIDEVNGELQWANPLDLDAYTGPYDIESLSYFKRLCTDVQVNGQIGLASGAPFAMSTGAGQIFLASKLIFQPSGGNQDLQALALGLFTQATWTGEWSDDPIGSGTTGQYDDINFPIQMANNGSVTERWRIEFVTASTVNVIGETFGQVLTAVTIGEDIAPVNPATGTPYFTIQAAGWSGGWQTGNVVRFNTLGANDPVWIIRSTQPGDAPELPTDRFIAHLQGDTAQEV